MSTAPRPVGADPDLETMRRFWARCEARPGGCLVARNTARNARRFGTARYPTVVVNGRATTARRLAFRVHHGEPQGRVWTTCGNLRCVNPDHLSDRPPATHYGEGHPQARLTEVDVCEIRERVAAGETQAALAHDKGITPSAVQKIVSRTLWRSVA